MEADAVLRQLRPQAFCHQALSWYCGKSRNRTPIFPSTCLQRLLFPAQIHFEQTVQLDSLCTCPSTWDGGRVHPALTRRLLVSSVSRSECQLAQQAPENTLGESAWSMALPMSLLPSMTLSHLCTPTWAPVFSCVTGTPVHHPSVPSPLQGHCHTPFQADLC